MDKLVHLIYLRIFNISEVFSYFWNFLSSLSFCLWFWPFRGFPQMFVIWGSLFIFTSEVLRSLLESLCLWSLWSGELIAEWWSWDQAVSLGASSVYRPFFFFLGILRFSMKIFSNLPVWYYPGSRAGEVAKCLTIQHVGFPLTLNSLASVRFLQSLIWCQLSLSLGPSGIVSPE